MTVQDYDYPISDNLIEKLKDEYRKQSATKGNSWRNELSLDDLITKLREEYDEVIEEYRMVRSNNRQELSDEIVDEILVLMMLWQRLNTK